MEIKNFLVVIWLLLTFFDSGSASDPSTITENSKAKPVYKCTQSGTTCTFSNVILNSTHYEWQPTADNPKVVLTVRFSGSKIPVATKDICETFPELSELYLNSIGMEEIEEDAFHACYELIRLDLYSNRIKEIPQATFLYTKNLQMLRSYDNQIMSLNHYNLFSNMPNLTVLYLYQNNLTEYSPELIRNNKKLNSLSLRANHLSNIETEQIVDFLPNLSLFNLDDNEMSCTRVVEINEFLAAKGIRNEIISAKKRYYPQEKVSGGYLCNPDISWMASNYRKENSNINHLIDSINEKLLTQQCSSSDLRNHIDEEVSKINGRFDQLEAKIDALMKCEGL